KLPVEGVMTSAPLGNAKAAVLAPRWSLKDVPCRKSVSAAPAGSRHRTTSSDPDEPSLGEPQAAAPMTSARPSTWTLTIAAACTPHEPFPTRLSYATVPPGGHKRPVALIH